MDQQGSHDQTKADIKPFIQQLIFSIDYKRKQNTIDWLKIIRQVDCKC